MDIQLTRIPDGHPNRFRMEIPEGSIVVSGTGGFVVGAPAALMAEGSMVRRLIIEHVDPEELLETWRQAMKEAGFNLPDGEES